MNDILFSEWSRFHSREQLSGFSRAGLSVHWIGNLRPPENVSRRSFQWLSWALLRAHYALSKIGLNHLMFDPFSTKKPLVHLSMRAFNRSAAATRWEARAVWAYVDINANLLTIAKQRGIPSILDVPIGHQRDHLEILRSEYQANGLPPPGRWVESWTRLCEEQYAIADWITAGSTFVKRTLVARGVPAEKILVNPYGVDTTRWRRCADTPRDYDGLMRFVFTANLILRKGIHYLLKAWKLAAIPNAELLVFGDGTLDWDRIVGGVPPSVKMLGSASHEQLAAAYAGAHVYVLPSLFEGLARSGLEAMAAGLPLIITEETGLGDFVQDGKEGWFVPSRSAEQLAERLRWCAEHRDAVKTAAENARNAGQSLTFESFGDRCASIARALISGASPRDALA